MYSRTFISVACLFILYSCQKPFLEPESTAPAKPLAEFKARVNGADFIAELTGATIRSSDSVISITAETSDGQKIAFAVRDSGEHVYDLPIYSTTEVGTYVSAVSIAYSSNAGFYPGDSGGTLEITKLDRINRLISGTFSFKGFHEDDM
ncbi:MAG TPA: DUF6252 family protein, partial [Chitinophagaceae bacterium]|nr:DUF6252 family protein [Chitinophagaceae bacterium]